MLILVSLTLVLTSLLSACSNEERMTVRATAFNSTRAQTDSRPTESACGDTLRPGIRAVAVSRDLAKLGLDCGTEVRIEGLKGSYSVVDLTAARHEKLIDIYMGRDIKAARQWGVQEVEIAWNE
jgi:3D (Asp-Asp-Asp) domain-containing protein